MISPSLRTYRHEVNRWIDDLGFSIAIRSVLILLVTALIPSVANAAPPLEEISYSRLRDLDTHCPMSAPESLQAWEKRAEELRLQLRVSLGLHPAPKLDDGPATIYGKMDLDGYSVEKIYFQVLPTFYVTGSLYRPTSDKASANARRPLVLFAHGHWDNGRFYCATDDEVKQLLASGAERFENAAKNHMQAQCVQLARMGFVVFQYDMIGYADSRQISLKRAHRFGIDDADVTLTDSGWPFFSTYAEAMLQSIMGLQTISTIRAVDLLSKLPDVDPKRIAITGASGGGTQSFIAVALDPRISGAFPAVMVSAEMQGGCTCENACGLRVGTGNVEIASLAAPRPLGITAANDWTKNVVDDGFPQLRAVYRLYGKESEVSVFSATHFPHNYNHVSRVAMYAWANRHFNLGLEEPILERDFELLGPDQLTVWNAEHPAPEAGDVFERKFLRRWSEDVLVQTFPIQQHVDAVREGWKTLLAPALELSSTMKSEHEQRIDQSLEETVIRNQQRMIVGRAISEKTIARTPDMAFPSMGIAVNIESATGSKDFKVVAIDPFTDDLTLSNEQPLVKNPRPSAAYTYGYNPPQRVRQLAVFLRVLQQLCSDEHATRVTVAADDDGRFFAAGAKLLDPQLPIDIKPLEAIPPDLTHYPVTIRDPRFIPGEMRYCGLAGLEIAAK